MLKSMVHTQRFALLIELARRSRYVTRIEHFLF